MPAEPDYVRYFALKNDEQPGDVLGPIGVTVVYGANGPKYMEHRVVGPLVRQAWLMPIWLNAG